MKWYEIIYTIMAWFAGSLLIYFMLRGIFPWWLDKEYEESERQFEVDDDEEIEKN